MTNPKSWAFHPGKTQSSGAQFEDGLGEILTQGAEISPCIGLREKWESP